jgi:phosphomannomutase
MNHIFDVDGTLTPSRGYIDPEFREFFKEFCNKNNVYLVTGSDRLKTLEQVGYSVYNACKRVYNCSGNDVYEGSENVSKSPWIMPEMLHEYLSVELTESKFPNRTGLHFEHRTGMCNFSVVGRYADNSARTEYYKWDCEHKEREKIAESVNTIFPSIQADVGGETGIDIFPKGKDKSQILKDFDKDTIQFYGDRTDPAGNDYSIASLLHSEQVFAVKDWQHTWELLK